MSSEYCGIEGCACPDGGVGIQQQLAGRVKASLKAWDRPQKSLANAVGISEKHLSQVLNGKAWPPPELWDRLLFNAEIWPKYARGTAPTEENP